MEEIIDGVDSVETNFRECFTCGHMLSAESVEWKEFSPGCSQKCVTMGANYAHIKLVGLQQKIAQERKEAKFWSKYWKNKRAKENAT